MTSISSVPGGGTETIIQSTKNEKKKDISTGKLCRDLKATKQESRKELFHPNVEFELVSRWIFAGTLGLCFEMTLTLLFEHPFK